MKVAAVVVDVTAPPQAADDVDGLVEHLMADVDRRPPSAGDVFVEVLAGPETEGESAVGENPDGGRLLGYHGRMVALDRTRHVGHQLDAGRGLGGRT